MNPLKDLSVLIVEDDPANAKLMSVLLRTEGCEVRVCASSEEAQEALAIRPAEVIVLDLVLPLMDGLTFARRVKADPTTKHIVIIATSVLNGTEIEQLALFAGCAAYVRKPIDALAFPQLVASHLRGHP